jgi:hypothetical protein
MSPNGSLIDFKSSSVALSNNYIVVICYSINVCIPLSLKPISDKYETNYEFLFYNYELV